MDDYNEKKIFTKPKQVKKKNKLIRKNKTIAGESETLEA